MDLFARLAEETRRAILREVARAHREDPHDPWLSFSALRDRVGARDSSNFNYHLKKLTDRYVRSEGGEYRVTPLGLRVAALLHETAADAPPAEVETDADCYCGASLTFRHADGVAAWDCGTGHDHRVLLPDAARADRSLEEVRRLAAAAAYDWHVRIADGCCPVCYAAIDPSFERQDPGDPIDPMLGACCEGCGCHLTVPVGAAALTHPTTLAFYGDHEIDVRDRSPVGLGLLATDPDLGDGVATVTTTVDGESLSATIARDGAVVSVERG